MVSVEHESIPPVNSHVRSVMNASGCVIEIIDDRRCRVSYITHIDLAGKVPEWFLRFVVSEDLQIMCRMREACIKAFKEQK